MGKIYERLFAKGDEPGHEFRGNQYVTLTTTTGSRDELDYNLSNLKESGWDKENEVTHVKGKLSGPPEKMARLARMLNSNYDREGGIDVHPSTARAMRTLAARINQATSSNKGDGMSIYDKLFGKSLEGSESNTGAPSFTGAMAASNTAENASTKAMEDGSTKNHMEAAGAHHAAFQAHMAVGNKASAMDHAEKCKSHCDCACNAAKAHVSESAQSLIKSAPRIEIAPTLTGRGYTPQAKPPAMPMTELGGGKKV